MKKSKVFIFSLVLLLFISLFSLSVCAEDYGEFSITVPDEYVTAVYGDNMDNISKIIGIKNTEIKKYFEKNNLLFLSVNYTNTSQIKLSALADDFSSKIVSFNNLDNARLIELANSFFTGDYEKVSNNTEIIENNNLKFLMYKETLTDSGGEYTVTQFVTVYSKKTYRLSVITTSEQAADFVEQIFYSFTLKEQITDNPFSISNVLIVSGIIVFLAVIVYTIFGIIKTFKKADINDKTEPSE